VHIYVYMYVLTFEWNYSQFLLGEMPYQNIVIMITTCWFIHVFGDMVAIKKYQNSLSESSFNVGNEIDEM
jgi:hypothetical protein